MAMEQLFCVLIQKRSHFVVDYFQMSIRRPTFGGQMRDQEAAIQQTFHLERSSFFYLSALMVRTRLLACTLHTAALNTDPDSCPPEVNHGP